MIRWNDLPWIPSNVPIIIPLEAQPGKDIWVDYIKFRGANTPIRRYIRVLLHFRVSDIFVAITTVCNRSTVAKVHFTCHLYSICHCDKFANDACSDYRSIEDLGAARCVILWTILLIILSWCEPNISQKKIEIKKNSESNEL